MANQNMIIGYIITATLAGGLGVFGGMTYQKNKVGSQFGMRANGGRIMQTQNGAQSGRDQQAVQTSATNGMMGKGGAITGEVTAKDDKSITVKMMDGSSKIVVLSEATSYRRSEESSLDNVQVGTKVATFGTVNSDGSTTATSIEIDPQMLGQMAKQ
jgi:hypothetical protein